MKLAPPEHDINPTRSTISQPATRLADIPSLIQPLLLVFSAATLALVSATLGSDEVEGETRSFDMYSLQWALALRSDHPWLADVMRDLSGMGSTIVLTLVIIATAGYLQLNSAWATALMVATSAMSGTVLVSMLKAAFGRLRPDLA